MLFGASIGQTSLRKLRPNSLLAATFASMMTFGVFCSAQATETEIQRAYIVASQQTAQNAPSVGLQLPLSVSLLNVAEPKIGIDLATLGALPSLRKNPAENEVFGAPAIAVNHLVADRRWDAIAPHQAKDLFNSTCRQESGICDTGLIHLWNRLRKDSRTGSALDLVRHLNTEVNMALNYRNDMANYGVVDYWASPYEIARRSSADCKGYAITKLWMLTALDFAPEQMKLVVVKDTSRNLGHAVLVVNIDGASYVLDNMTNEVRAESAVHAYQPLYAMNETGKWIYGIRKTPEPLAENFTSPGAVPPFGMNIAMLLRPGLIN